MGNRVLITNKSVVLSEPSKQGKKINPVHFFHLKV